MLGTGNLIVVDQIAVLCIAASGLCLVLRQRAIAARLFGSGLVLAAAVGLAANRGEWFTGLAIWLSALSLCAAIWGARRRAIYFVMAAAVLAMLVPLLQLLTPVLHLWWLIPLIGAVAICTALIAPIGLRRLWAHIHDSNANFVFSRLLSRFLELIGGIRPRRRKRNRHIGEFGTTKRGRSGPGPHTI